VNYFLGLAGWSGASGLGLGGRPSLLFCLPKAPKGIYDHRREAAHYSGYSPTCETALSKINARYNTACPEYECKYLTYDGDNQIRKRNSVFGFNHYRGLIPRPSGRNTGGVGDLFPRIRKDFKEKSLIPHHSWRGFFIIGGIMGFHHTHYPFRKGRPGVFIPFQHFRFRKWALKSSLV
jgi:hypothetical protein